MSTLQTTLSSQSQKIGDIETALTDTDGRLTAVEKLCNTLQAENTDLKLKLDDLENRSRRQNVRVIGIPEGLEGQNPVTFMSSMFTVLYGEGAFERPPRNRSSPPCRAKIPTQRIPEAYASSTPPLSNKITHFEIEPRAETFGVQRCGCSYFFGHVRRGGETLGRVQGCKSFTSQCRHYLRNAAPGQTPRRFPGTATYVPNSTGCGGFRQLCY